MDSTAFHELIAHVRGTAAELALAEQKVAAFKAELAQQERGAQLDSARQRAIRPIPRRQSGWPLATDTHVQSIPRSYAAGSLDEAASVPE
jgi:hypothetical protein